MKKKKILQFSVSDIQFEFVKTNVSIHKKSINFVSGLSIIALLFFNKKQTMSVSSGRICCQEYGYEKFNF